MTSLRRLNRSVLTIVTECLLSGRNWKFKYISGKFYAPKAVLFFQVVSRRPLNAKAQVRSQVSPREICVGRNGNGIVIPPHASIFPCQYNSSKLPHPPSSTRCSYQQDKRAKSRNIPKAKFFGNPGEPERKVLSLTSYSGWLKQDAWRCGTDWNVSGSNPAMGTVWKCRVL
jgi:hypothetical protein